MVQVNTARAELLGVTPSDIYTTLQAHLGSQFVNYFNLQSQVFQVIVQDAGAVPRPGVATSTSSMCRSSSGAMVPMNSLVDITTVQGSNAVTRYNLYPSVEINGSARGRAELRPVDAGDGAGGGGAPAGGLRL